MLDGTHLRLTSSKREEPIYLLASASSACGCPWSGSTEAPQSGGASPIKRGIRGFGGRACRYWAHFSVKQNNSLGFSLTELLVIVLAGATLAAIAIPVMNGAMISMRLHSTVSAMSAAVSSTRYRAIKDSQAYTLTLTTPNNSYVVINMVTGNADSAVPLPNPATAFNAGANATYTFTLCPNGTVYGAGGACPGNSTPPALAATYQGREIDINVSSTGNVTTTTIH